jgi:DNA-binding GntR family transcriptional regulator
VQEKVASQLGVSRQPVQQALAMLKNEGLLQELGKRGLFVAPLDPASMRHHYEIRAALDGLAARRAAERAHATRQVATSIKREGDAIIAQGQDAIAKGSIAQMVQCDVTFHEFVYEASGNPLLATTAALHWRQFRRVMGEVLRQAEPPRMIWQQHGRILDAIVAGDGDHAEAEAVTHVWTAADRLETALRAAPTGNSTEASP